MSKLSIGHLNRNFVVSIHWTPFRRSWPGNATSTFKPRKRSDSDVAREPARVFGLSGSYTWGVHVSLCSESSEFLQNIRCETSPSPVAFSCVLLVSALGVVLAGGSWLRQCTKAAVPKQILVSEVLPETSRCCRTALLLAVTSSTHRVVSATWHTRHLTNIDQEVAQSIVTIAEGLENKAYIDLGDLMISKNSIRHPLGQHASARESQSGGPPRVGSDLCAERRSLRR
ncbi:hypothetical protein PAXRUDRAFT_244246 [Paxillus rubicundulus Ve08.2h10]|uniref:Uncharacterized protein n=1 Tax=Paxillus rubicundulus Ve08.2h10 TaxID=930991 RepID=A0A0D0CXC1_9AGAM|nr:hypothetical protein PAXRUDRAFT_244246 [Paxillus rubicundulus Ve08.2h10]